MRSSSRRRNSVAGAKNPGRASARDELRLLVVVDISEASKRVLRYVCRLAVDSTRTEVHLAYLEPHLPPALLESGGAESPTREQEVEAELQAEQRAWISTSDRKSDRILRSARNALERAGVAASRIRTCTSSPLDAASAADAVLLLARDERCGTIVIGHRAHGWFRGVAGGHLAEQLVRKASGNTVWVVN
jgi:nucleotide-binding universal stress UspA family protein